MLVVLKELCMEYLSYNVDDILNTSTLAYVYMLVSLQPIFADGCMKRDDSTVGMMRESALV